MLIALCSAKGSPGATTSALALAMAWPQRVVLAECDPAGGDVLAGYGQGQTRAGSQGLIDLMAAARKGTAELELWTHLVTLDPVHRAFVLPGLADARTSRAIDWPRLVALLTGSGAHVLADCGRLRAEHPPRAVLYAADLVLLVCRATLRSVRSAQSATADLTAELTARGTGADALGVLLIDPGTPFGAVEVEKALGVPVVTTLPADARAAAVLSDGTPAARRFATSPLLKAGQRAAEEISAVASARRARLGAAPETGAARLPGIGRPAPAIPVAGTSRSGSAARGAATPTARPWGEAITANGQVGHQSQEPPRWRDPAPLYGPGEGRS